MKGGNKITELCTNCNKVIPQSEQAYVHKGKIVCWKCYGLLQRRGHKSWWGTRSGRYFIVLLAWTAFMIYLGFITPIPRNPDEIGGILNLCCPFGLWLLFAIPLAFGAFISGGK